MKRTELLDASLLRRTGHGRRLFGLFLLAMLLVTAWSVAPGYGQSRRDRHGGWARHGAAVGVDDIGFVARRLHPEDEDARARFVALVTEAIDEGELLRIDANRLTEAIAAELRAGRPDPAVLEHLRQEAGDLALRAVDAGFDAFGRVVQDLSPEQRRELAGYFEERHR